MNNNDCCTKYFNLCLDAKHLLNNEIKVHTKAIVFGEKCMLRRLDGV